MKEIFITFLKQEGFYDSFRLKFWKQRGWTIDYLIHNHKCGSYILALTTKNDGITDWNSVSDMWEEYWYNQKKKLLYEYVVNEQNVFTFISKLPKGITFESMFNHTTNLVFVFENIERKELSDKPYWNKMGKHWEKWIKTKLWT